MFEYDSNQVGNHTGIWQKNVLACSENFACVPCCHNDKSVTTYEGPQNLTLLEDISIKFIAINCLISS